MRLFEVSATGQLKLEGVTVDGGLPAYYGGALF